MAFQMYGARAVPGTYQAGTVVGPYQHLDGVAGMHPEVTNNSRGGQSICFPSAAIS